MPAIASFGENARHNGSWQNARHSGSWQNARGSYSCCHQGCFKQGWAFSSCLLVKGYHYLPWLLDSILVGHTHAQNYGYQ
jgi:hypothetical protein